MRQIVKRFFIVVFFCVVGSLCMSAENLQEVLYLKNGSIIRGTILELVPEKSVKIQTGDGSIFVYQMSEVEKITKGKPYPTYNSTEEEPYGYEKAPRYRGFANFTMAFGSGDYSYNRIMFSTTHGAQITPEIFAGVGIGLMDWFDYNYYDYYGDGYDYDDVVSVPLFAEVRGELHNIFHRNFSPYLDLKLGYNMVNVQGVFFSPEVGMHFYFGHQKIGIGFGIGYHLQSAEVWEYSYSRYGNTQWYSSREILNAFSLNVAFDF